MFKQAILQDPATVGHPIFQSTFQASPSIALFPGWIQFTSGTGIHLRLMYWCTSHIMSTPSKTASTLLYGRHGITKNQLNYASFCIQCNLMHSYSRVHQKH